MTRMRISGEWIGVTLLFAVLAWAAASQQWLWRFDAVLYDATATYRHTEPDPDLVVVAIDDRSLAEVGRWPWSRAVHAALLDRLDEAEARAVVLDLILHERSDDVRADEVLAASIAGHGRVVLPLAQASYGTVGDGELLPEAIFREAAAALGHTHIELDPDGIARTVYLWEGAGRPRHAQLALAALRLVEPDRGAAYPTPDEAHASGWRRAEWRHVPFLGPPGTFRYVSYGDVLRGTVPESILRDAIVFVGMAAAGGGGAIPVPTSQHGNLMPGVEMQATLYHGLRHGRVLQRASLPTEVAFNLSVVLLLMIAMLRLRPRAAMFAALGTAVSALAISWLLREYAMLWLPPSFAVLAGLAAYPLWSWRRLEASRRYFESELEGLGSGCVDANPAPRAPSPIVLDPFVERIAMLRHAMRRQRDMQRSREETLDFLSHDLRTPLSAILLAVDTRRARGEGPTDPTLLRIERSARKSLDLADRLVHLIRAESIEASQFDTVSLDLVLQEAVDDVWLAAGAKSIELVVDVDLSEAEDQPSLVLGDEDLLRRALVNLLDNAIRHTPQGGRVRLALRSCGASWEIEVCDEGDGIPSEQHDLLFRRHARLPGASKGGAGLGLLMVRTVVERHGGTVSVDSAPGRGARFCIRLPQVLPLRDRLKA